jgi:AcrR family transcriptional regulator
LTPPAAEAARRKTPDPSSRRPLFAKLKPGPGRSSEEVEANQRARLRGAMVELVAAGGYRSVKVRGLTRAAGVSTRTLYKRFGNVEGCFAATYEALMGCALERTAAAVRDGGEGEPGLRAGLRELIGTLAGQPKQAHLVLVGAYAAGPAMRERMRAALAGFERLLVSALATSPTCPALPPCLAQGAVAGIAHVARTRLLAGPPPETGIDRQVADRLPDQVGDWILSLRAAPPADPAAAHRAAGPAARRRWDLSAGLRSEVGDERGRILAAVVRLGTREGYGALTVPKIRSEAAVSRRSFDAHFAGVEDCFLAAIETLALAIFADSERLAAGGDWERAVQRATLFLCTEAARSQALARLVFVDVLAPGLEGLCGRERTIVQGAARLRRAAPSGRRPSELTAEASLAAVWQVMQNELGAGRGGDLPQLAPMLAYVLTSSA